MRHSVRFISTCVETATLTAGSLVALEVHLHVCGDSASRSVFSLEERRFISTCVETAGSLCSHAPLRPVHLHVCGDSKVGNYFKAGDGGSSPRVWRQRSVSCFLAIICRFISTCVETAGEFELRTRRLQVHLHVCGDSVRFQMIIFNKHGSSPRVWRQLFAMRYNWAWLRFISTCVETAHGGEAHTTSKPVHLHVCGDSNNARRYESELEGSSPRVWRQRRFDFRDSGDHRFISTCVETAVGAPIQPLKHQVHLHVCGDSRAFLGMQGRAGGSSPRVWRQRVPCCVYPAVNRFISTCVETAVCVPTVRPPNEVHLHVCGDSVRRRHRRRFGAGSSPRVWRQRPGNPSATCPYRFISTCVETAQRKTRSKKATKVHLHVCGDSWKTNSKPGSGDGSSPRVWRQRCDHEIQTAGGRFISTCVETAHVLRAAVQRPTVHLHVCGDSARPMRAIGRQRGSSPRVWRQHLENTIVWDIFAS